MLALSMRAIRPDIKLRVENLMLRKQLSLLKRRRRRPE
jgi:hypothetical protein